MILELNKGEIVKIFPSMQKGVGALIQISVAIFARNYKSTNSREEKNVGL